MATLFAKPLAAPVIVTPSDALALSRQFYGIDGHLLRLGGEKDSNYRLTSTSGETFLLKIVHPDENPGLTNMHTLALMHVAATDPGLPVQRVIATKDGRAEVRHCFARGDIRTVRLVTFTEGVMQRNSPHTPRQRTHIGEMLARLQLALSNFSHPADTHPIAWDLNNVEALLGPIDEIAEGTEARDLRHWIEVFENEVKPSIDRLPAQVVHNDLNSDNIIVSADDTDQVAGIIDFGDMVRTSSMFDVAVGAAYQLTEAGNPLSAACDFIRGFHLVKPLSELEISLLFKAIMARMVMRIAITEWRAMRVPENKEYILRNTPQVWRQFRVLSAIPEREATRKIKQTLQGREF